MGKYFGRCVDRTIVLHTPCLRFDFECDGQSDVARGRRGSLPMKKPLFFGRPFRKRRLTHTITHTLIHHHRAPARKEAEDEQQQQRQQEQEQREREVGLRGL